MFTLILFAVLTFFLMVKLNDILGFRVGFTVEKEKLPNFEKAGAQEVSVSELDRKIQKLQQMDPSFNIDDFKRKAQKAFEMIFEAYAKEDKDTLKVLLDPRIFRAFALAIDDRRQRSETLEGMIVRFVSIDILDVNIEGSDCSIVVKFITEQSDILRDESGGIIEGNPNFVENRTDVWAFSRDISSTNPAWYLKEIKTA